MAAEIYNLLYQLGVTANYTGFFHTAYAVYLCAEQPDRLLLVTKWLYPEVAKQYKTNWKAVERNIRTVGGIIWRENRPLLEHLARRNLTKKPRTTQLLSILASSLNSSGLTFQEPESLTAVQSDTPQSEHPAEPAAKSSAFITA